MSKNTKLFVFVVIVAALVLSSTRVGSAARDPFLIEKYKGTYTSTGSAGDITLTLNEDLSYTWVCNSGPCENSSGQWEVYLASQTYVYLNDHGSVKYLQDLKISPMKLRELITGTVFTREEPSLHVGDLDGAGVPVGPRWQATMTITIQDENGNPVAAATVTGDWSGGYIGTAVCTTDSSGVCSVTSGQMRSKSKSATFTVTAVGHPAFTYDATANSDPDGDSDGTSIVVFKP